jgi:hypothetical protein
VNIDAVLARTDVDAVIERVDIDAVMRRVDLNAIVDRIDVNEIVGRIDIDSLIAETDLGAIIASSSSSAATEALDAARSQAVGLDHFIDRWVGRVLRRKHPGPAGPAAALDAQAESLDQAES